MEHFRAADQVPVRVLNQILLEVSTRGPVGGSKT
jgi:hypothetical protein